MTQIILVSGATWNVPSDWNSANNSIEGIGAGGNGAAPPTAGNAGAAAGGGGGEYRKASNVTLTPSSTVDINIPSGGAGSGANGAWIKNGGGTIVMEAKNGGNASTVTAGAGGTGGTGAAASAVGAAGGGGNTPGTTLVGAAGGGGSGGPIGTGKTGGNAVGGRDAGAGGGGSNGGSSTVGGDVTGDTTGSNGGQGTGGAGAGSGGTSSADATAGTSGGGGGGGDGATSAHRHGAAGGMDTIAQMQRDQAEADARKSEIALTNFAAQAGRIQNAAQAFTGVEDRLGRRFDVISRDLRDAIKSHPLPSGCMPDAGRMRALSQAIATANAAIGARLGRAMPDAD
jgi:hypothetical protein